MITGYLDPWGSSAGLYTDPCSKASMQADISMSRNTWMHGISMCFMGPSCLSEESLSLKPQTTNPEP